MARYSNGMNGPLSGKVGTVVAATWKGIPYQRSLPTVNRNRKRSDSEKANNNKFGFVSSWFSPLKEFLRVSMAAYPRPMTWLNVAYTLNHQLFTPTDEGFEPDYPNLQLSYGTLPVLQSPVLETNGAAISLTWDTAGAGNSRDQLALIIYEPGEGLWDGFIGRASRGEGRCDYRCNIHTGATVHLYVFLTSIDRARVSASQYLGTLVL